jgi:cell wall-associated NlpC family hydrolase
MSTRIPLDPGVGGRSIALAALQTADIIVSTTRAAVSGAIRFGTASEVSHAMLYAGNGRVIEAIGSGVVERNLSEAIADAQLAVAYRYQNLGARGSAIVSFARRQVGSAYDTGGAALSGITHHRAAALSMASPLLGIILLTAAITERRDRFFCSELVLQAYESAGVRLTPIASRAASPQRIIEAVASQELRYVGHLKTS